MTQLVAEDITVAFRRTEVLSGVSFAAPAGSLTAIVGPNGSGKTTLLRALTGEVPHRGRVWLNGQDTARLPAWQLAALRAVQPQATALAFPFTVLEVVRLGLTAGAEATQADRPLQALDRVGLRGHADRFYQQLSGGEKQRVQFARALTQVWTPMDRQGPRWLLLDEPVSSLDIGHQLQVMQQARRFADAGGGVVAVMHDLNLSAMFADRLLVLGEGRLLADGPPDTTMRDDILSRAYGCPVAVGRSAGVSGPYVLPQMAARP